jgi:hypothetical protein
MTSTLSIKPHNDTADWEKRGPLLFGAAMAIYVGFCVLMLQRPLSWLLAVMPDDVFYYLQVARNLAQHGVSSFDGETLTNGYHPGWMLLMTVLAKLISGRMELLHACLIASLMLHAVASWGLARVLRPFAGTFWAWIGGAFWLLNPLPLRVALQGMEGTLYVLAIVVVMLVFQQHIAPHLRHTPCDVPTRALVLFGLSLSFAFWARTEGILLAAISLLYAAVAIVRSPSSTRLRSIMRMGLLSGGTFVLHVAPWFVFSLLATGSLGQKSGAMKMLWARDDYSGLALWERLLVLTEFLRAWWFSVAPTVLFNRAYSVVALAAAIVLFVLIALAVRTLRDKETSSGGNDAAHDVAQDTASVSDTTSATLWCQMAAWLLPMLLLSGSVYGLLFADHRAWYWGQPGVIFFVLFYGGAALCLRRAHWTQSPRARSAVGFGVLAYALVLCFSFSRAVPAVYRLQPGAYESVAWLEQRVPPTARIGVFNAGVPAYFSHLKIINLDGLMNNTVADRWRAHHFGDYLHEARIDYIADLEVSLERARKFSDAPLPLHKVAYHAPSWRTLWRVETKAKAAQSSGRN